MKMKNRYLVAFLLLLPFLISLISFVVDAKGFTGSRSRGGGYSRSSKSGYYSSRYYYSSPQMYWRSNYQYSSSYAGPSFRVGGAQSLDPNANIMCRRTVIADNSSVSEGSFETYIVYNSTQYCYEERNTNVGDTANTPVESLMLNRYRFNISITPFPQIDLFVYPDKDISTPSLNSTLRIVSVGFSSSKYEANILKKVNLSELLWSSCTFDSCNDEYAQLTKLSSIGFPSSRFLEGSRVDFSSVRAVWQDAVELELHWWLSTDFSESQYDHVFLFPSTVKFDIVTRIINNTKFSELLGFDPNQSPVYLNVESLFVGADTGEGSQLMFLPTKVGKEATEYDPQEMERIQYGTTVDSTNYKAAFVSYATADNRDQLCFADVPNHLDDNSTCVTLLGRHNISRSVVCKSSDTTLPYMCQNLFSGSNQKAVNLNFMFQRSFGNKFLPEIHYYLNFGVVDPAVKELSAGNVATTSVIIILLMLVASLLL